MTIICETEDVLISELMKLIKKHEEEAIKESGCFKIGLSGGSVTNFLTKGLPTLKTDFTKWLFFFCDERVVPVDDSYSTFGEYKKNLFGKIPLKDEQFVTIKQGVGAEEAALDYAEKLAKYFPNESIPSFDLLVLGIGPDGHTCSLFPGHELLDETTVWVRAITDSPKPPDKRITLTFPVINNAKACVFPLAGASKAEIVKRIIKDNEDLPARRVKPSKGNLYWIIEDLAAKHL